MILAEVYKEAMNHIAVTTDMRSRILDNIKNLDFQATKTKPHPSPVRYWAAAACFAAIIAGTMVLPNFLTSIQAEHPSEVQHGILDRTEVSSLSELSQTVGFEVDDLKNLPFDIIETFYTAYGNEMAEVKYVGETKSLIFRKAFGSTDPSGDYTSYSDTLILDFSHGSATLKGNSGMYCLATWLDDTYSYSIRVSTALSDVEWIRIFESMGYCLTKN